MVPCSRFRSPIPARPARYGPRGRRIGVRLSWVGRSPGSGLPSPGRHLEPWGGRVGSGPAVGSRLSGLTRDRPSLGRSRRSGGGRSAERIGRADFPLVPPRPAVRTAADRAAVLAARSGEGGSRNPSGAMGGRHFLAGGGGDPDMKGVP